MGQAFTLVVWSKQTRPKNDASLYADDGRVEYDAGITAVNLSLEVDGLGTHKSAFDETPIKVEATLLGAEYQKTNMSSGSTPTVTETMELAGDDVAPYFGVGYYKTDVIDGKKHYFAYVIYKMAFAKPDDSESTKGDKTAFGTKTISGSGMSTDGSDTAPKRYFEKKVECPTEKDAINFLKTTFNIKDATASSTNDKGE